LEDFISHQKKTRKSLLRKLMRIIHSARSASIGSSLAARLAG